MAAIFQNGCFLQQYFEEFGYYSSNVIRRYFHRTAKQFFNCVDRNGNFLVTRY